MRKEEEEEEENEGVTDYDRFIDEEMKKSLPAAIAREISEEPNMARREVYERTVPEPPREAAEVEAAGVSARVPPAEVDEKCPWMKERRGERRILLIHPSRRTFFPGGSAVDTVEVLILPPGETYIRCIIHHFRVAIRHCRTHYARIEGTAEGRRSLLSDGGL